LLVKYALLLLALLLGGRAFAQLPAAVPRLRAALQSHPQFDTVRVNRLNALGMAQYFTAPEQAKAAYSETLVVARRLGYKPGEALALLNMGFYYTIRNEYKSSLAYTQNARRLYGQLGDTLQQIKCLYNLSKTELNQGHYGPAIAYGLDALPLAEARADPKWLTLVYSQLGCTYQLLEDYAQARTYLVRGLRVARAAAQREGMARCLMFLGTLYRDRRQWASARDYYERSMAIQPAGTTGSDVWLLTEMAILEVRMGRDQAARAVAFEALRQLRRTNTVGFVPTMQLVLAQAYLHSGRLDSAAHYGQQVLRAGTSSGVLAWIRDANDALAQVSARQGRFADAYRYHLHYTTAQDSLNSQDLARHLAAVQYNYELKKNQARIQLLTRNEQLIRLKNQQQRWLLLGALGGWPWWAAWAWCSGAATAKNNGPTSSSASSTRPKTSSSPTSATSCARPSRWCSALSTAC
jgi:two-component system, NtrC family, sensor kinase